MAKELNSGVLLDTGLTDVVATPYLLGVAGTPIACAEIGATKMYHANAVDAVGSVAGVYIITFTSAASPSNYSVGTLVWSGTAEITNAVIAGYTNTARVVDGAITLAQKERLDLAALTGKRAGLGTATEEYYAQDGTTVRISLTPDASGNGTPVLNGA